MKLAPVDAANIKSKLQIKISHRNWAEALQQFHIALITAAPGEVVCLTGASRIGKTRLVQHVKELVTGSSDSAEYNKYLCVSVLAANTGTDGRFSTKSFAARLLAALDHPSLELLDDLARAAKLDRLTETGLVGMIVRSLRRRGVRYLIIDEAQHVQYTPKATIAPSAVMDAWKGLAEDAGVVLVIVGAYPVLSVIKESPHLSGRTRIIHFPPYAPNKEDMEEFLSIANTFLASSGQQICLNLNDYLPVLYEHTLGCIGLLRMWFLDALNYSERRGVPLTAEVLDTHRKPYSMMEGIIHEMEEGHRNLLLTKADFDASFVPQEKFIRTKSIKNKAFQKKPRRVAAENRT